MVQPGTNSAGGADLGQRLRELREARGLSRPALGEMAGLTAQAIANVEMGRRQPNSATLVALARALGASLDALVGLPPRGYPAVGDPEVLQIAEKLADLPPTLRTEAGDFVDYLWRKGRKAKHQQP